MIIDLVGTNWALGRKIMVIGRRPAAQLVAKINLAGPGLSRAGAASAGELFLRQTNEMLRQRAEWAARGRRASCCLLPLGGNIPIGRAPPAAAQLSSASTGGQQGRAIIEMKTTDERKRDCVCGRQVGAPPAGPRRPSARLRNTHTSL